MLSRYYYGRDLRHVLQLLRAAAASNARNYFHRRHPRCSRLRYHPQQQRRRRRHSLLLRWRTLK